MAKIQIAELAQVQTEFDELSDLELEAIVGGRANTDDILAGAIAGAAGGAAIGGAIGGAIGAVIGGLLGLFS
ncbi:Blp family class II bacteriocin [Nostoc sp. CHAB 5784]|uniref:Blp family class II bacteriocin n=1 Tax=Nostoc mirabile TaxID=2907820 RepID=UPI001E29F24E|nr:Blp family class II bacteriocin [Nostoc mirabile]MCC5669079.1 Blp family class II bacteriocin [Nostoc mirabile CHAB5784]